VPSLWKSQSGATDHLIHAKDIPEKLGVALGCLSVFPEGYEAMKELVEKIVRALVDHPEEVVVREIKGPQTEILEIKVSKGDMGELIGKNGQNITAIRRIVSAAGKGKGKRSMVEVLGEWHGR
jgi:predicted RNA-binding protein YlqC (UPF0109 family)